MQKAFKIRFVDGSFIRNHLDTNFGFLEEHARAGFSPSYYIPEGELWVDKHYRAELPRLIKIRELYNNPKYARLSYQKIREILKRELVSHETPPPFIEQTEKNGALTINHVNGHIVREYIDPEFIFGGHDLVYNYIPKNEVWLDALQGPRELPYTTLHELTERAYMKQGMNYDAAHDIAIAVEKSARRTNGDGCFPGDDGFTKKFLLPYAAK